MIFEKMIIIQFRFTYYIVAIGLEFVLLNRLCLLAFLITSLSRTCAVQNQSASYESATYISR